MGKIAPFLALALVGCITMAMASDRHGGAGLRNPDLLALKRDHPLARWYDNGQRISRVYGRALSLGLTPLQSAQGFLAEYAGIFHTTPADLHAPQGRPLVRGLMPYDNGKYKFTLVEFQQRRQDTAVFRSSVRVLVRNLPGFPVVLVSSTLKRLDAFTVEKHLMPIAPETGRGAARQQRPGLEHFTDLVPVIWAGLPDDPQVPRLAARFYASQADGMKWLFIVDAGTGEVVYREDALIAIDVTGNVSGQATTGWGSEQCEAEAAAALPYAEVNIGATTANADADGDFVISNAGFMSVTVESRITGPWFDIVSFAGSNALLSQSVVPPGPADFVHNATNVELERAQVNAYVATNTARDYLLNEVPGLPGTSNSPLTVNVNRVDGLCPQNAWFEPADPSINFCVASSPFPNTAFSTIVFHEYGHHLIEEGGGGQAEYGEGMADAITILVTDEPEIGVGFNGPCDLNSALRSGDNTVSYPCGGSFHFCGQMLSGAIWNTRNELLVTEPAQYRSIIADLTLNSIPLHPGIFIDPSITIDFLTLDDDDGDLDNGTPHYNEICTGFTAHGLTCPSADGLLFEYPSGLPEVVVPNTAAFVFVNIIGIGGQPAPGSGQISYRIDGGSFTTVPMVQLQLNQYQTLLPPAPCGSIIEYYFRAQTSLGEIFTDPVESPGGAFVSPSALQLTTIAEYDFETDPSWTVTNDPGLGNGAWELGSPIGGGNNGDPVTDYDGSGQCWLTDNAIGDSDVDGGGTNLTTESFDLSFRQGPLLSYARWFSNHTGGIPNDVMVVELSDDEGQSWVELETAGPSGEEANGGWVEVHYRVADTITLSADTQVRFRAADTILDTVVEAGIDAFRLVDMECMACTDPCDDGDPCTLNDACVGNNCVGTPVDCSGSSNDCNVASCDVNGLAGNCDILTPVVDGTTCEDGSACTVNDTCQIGVCAPGAPPDCSAFDTECGTAACDPAGLEGNCTDVIPVADGSPCDDGDTCLIGESCQAGVCTGSAPPDCTPFEDQCSVASCDPAGFPGNCNVLEPATNGIPCDDNNACTTDETCQSGACTAGTPVDCSHLSDQCNTVSCLAIGAPGNCDVVTPHANGIPCDDNDACNINEACQAGVCAGGSAPDCLGDDTACTVASCDAAGADGNCDIDTPRPDGTTCDDGVACNVGEACLAGACNGGAPQDCAAFDDQCNVASCDTAGAEGNCVVLTARADGTDCDDGLACNVGEACLAGACAGGATQDCSSLNDQCNVVSCDPGGNEANCDVVTPRLDGTDCDDDLVCNIGEACLEGVCTGGAAPDCAALNDECTTAHCAQSGAEGNCDRSAARPNGTPCDDGDACNIGERCQDGECMNSSPTDCSAFNTQCTFAVCDIGGFEGNCLIAQLILNGTPCDDDDPCTLEDACMHGTCTAGTAVDCTPFDDDCNTVSCSASGALGNCDVVAPRADGTVCDDGNPCLLGEACQSGVCINGMPVNCGDSGDDCNTASCSPTGSDGNCDVLTPFPDGTDCDDGDACLVDEQCTNGTCASGVIPDCSAFDDDCNLASCDTAGPEGNCDQQTPLTNGTPCDDGQACAIGEQCEDGVCTVGDAVQCPDGADICRIFSCDAGGAEGNCDTDEWVADGTPCGQDGICEAGHCAISCMDADDCGDADSNGVIDDGCLWYDCPNQVCEASPRPFADAGGPFGACPFDTFANVHDRTHVLKCFGGTNPCASINHDLGGAFGNCIHDGFCNIHDAAHVDAAFSGRTTCSCPSGPAPHFEPQPVGFTQLTLHGPATVSHGAMLDVVVQLESGIEDLKGYQLFMRTSGGTAGRLQLRSVEVTELAEGVYSEDDLPYSAHNITEGAVLAGAETGVSAVEHSQLAVFTYVVSEDAAGTFVIDLEISSAHTVMFDSNLRPIVIESTIPWFVDVTPAAPRPRHHRPRTKTATGDSPQDPANK
jgi:hypothetical protein